MRASTPLDGAGDVIESERSMQSMIDKIGLSIAAASVLLACAVLYGWTVGSTLLISLFADAMNMQPLTAIGLAAGGVAVAGAYLRLDFGRYTAAALLAAIGLTALAQQAPGVEFGIDRVLFPNEILVQSPLPAHPGRPAVLIGVIFVLLGSALALIRSRSERLRVVAVLSASLALLVAVLSLLAYVVLAGEPLRTMSGTLGIPLHGGVAVAALCAATLLVRRDTGWVHLLLRGGEQTRIARLLLPVALVPIAAAFIANQGVIHRLYGPDVRMLIITELSATTLLLLAFWAAARLGRKRDELASLASALDLSPVFVRGQDGLIEHWPRGCEALYGWTAEEAVGKNAHELLRTVFPIPLTELTAVLHRDGLWRGELLHRTREGQEKWVASQWVVQDRGPHQCPRVVEAVTDITELKRTEAELRESEDRIAQAVAAYGLGIFDYYPPSGQITFSDELERMLGLEPGGLNGNFETWLSHVLPEDLERNRPESAAAISQRLPKRTYLIRIRRADGEVRNLHGVVRYLYAEDGSVRRAIGIHMDVTDQIRDREALAARETRLMEMQAELTHVSRFSAMGEMAAALAHELNQPLTAAGNFLGAAGIILGDADKVLDAVAQGRLRQAVKLAGDQTLRAGEIVRRLREFITRGEADTLVEDLNVMIGDAVALALPNARAAEVEVRVNLAPAATHVLADRIQVQQVLVNLIRNAGEAMRPQQTSRILTISAVLAGPMAQVSVADTGPGVAADVAEQLFTPFMSTKTTGMGVGLSICRRIIEAHGGELWIAESESGADFRFTLPLMDPDHEDDDE